MNEIFLMYLWLKLDTVCLILGFVSIVPFLIGFFAFVTFVCENGGIRAHTAAWKKWNDQIKYPSLYGKAGAEPTKFGKSFFEFVPRSVWVTYLTVVALSIAVPDKTEVAYMVGAHYAVRVANTPEADKLMTLIRKRANSILDEQLKKADTNHD